MVFDPGASSCAGSRPGAVDPGTRELSTIGKTTIGAIRGGCQSSQVDSSFDQVAELRPLIDQIQVKKENVTKPLLRACFWFSIRGASRISRENRAAGGPARAAQHGQGGVAPNQEDSLRGCPAKPGRSGRVARIFDVDPIEGATPPAPRNTKTPRPSGGNGRGVLGEGITFVGQSEAHHLGWHSHDRSVRTGWRYLRPTISDVLHPI